MEQAAAYTDRNSVEEGGDFYWYIPAPYIFLDAIVIVKKQKTKQKNKNNKKFTGKKQQTSV